MSRNLKKNHKLRGAVVRSYLPAHALVIMEPSELATDEARSAKHAAMGYDKGARRSNWKQANAALMAKQAGGELEDAAVAPRGLLERPATHGDATRVRPSSILRS